MDESVPFADDELPYDDLEVPDAGALDSMEREGESSELKARIGKKIYLIDESLVKKRKAADLEDDDEQIDNGLTDPNIRKNALLLQGIPITQMPTGRIFAYATYYDAHPIGLEWIDDQTCVLVFPSHKSAFQGWKVLHRAPQSTATSGMSQDLMAVDVEGSGDNMYPAHKFPMGLYQIDEHIGTVLVNNKVRALQEPIRIRWARASDIKAPDARVKSNFYKQHGMMAGKDGHLGLRGNNEPGKGNKRHRLDDEEQKRQLDAELDNFLENDQGPPSDRLGSRVRDRRDDWVGQPEERSQKQEEMRRQLDDELDSFLATGGDDEELFPATEPDEKDEANNHAPSLLERTGHGFAARSEPSQREIKLLPRRARAGRSGPDDITRRYATDQDGRWLHNAEIAERRQKDKFDEGGYGMRAWGSSQNRRPKRARKTQEELDQELDSLGQVVD